MQAALRLYISDGQDPRSEKFTEANVNTLQKLSVFGVHVLQQGSERCTSAGISPVQIAQIR